MKYKYILLSSICLYDFSAVQTAMAQNNRTPNIIYIMSDDHASQAVSAYGGILSTVLPTPNIDRIAHEGAILRNCFVTNSISTPSRGAIITGQYSQKNGVYTLQDPLDPDHPNVAKCLQQAGYQTAKIYQQEYEIGKPLYSVNGICMRNLQVLIITMSCPDRAVIMTRCL